MNGKPQVAIRKADQTMTATPEVLAKRKVRNIGTLGPPSTRPQAVAARARQAEFDAIMDRARAELATAHAPGTAWHDRQLERQAILAERAVAERDMWTRSRAEHTRSRWVRGDGQYADQPAGGFAEGIKGIQNDIAAAAAAEGTSDE
jgi:hypothetical protein